MSWRHLLPPVEAAVPWPLPPFESAACSTVLSALARPVSRASPAWKPEKRREAGREKERREGKRGEGRKKGEGKKKRREKKRRGKEKREGGRKKRRGSKKESSDLRFVSGNFCDIL